MHDAIERLKEYLLRFAPVRRAVRDRVLRSGHTDWGTLLAPDAAYWQKALCEAQDGPHVLIPTSVGSNMAATTLEGTLAAALTLRGCRVSLLLCDGVLDACMACQREWYSASFSTSRPLSRGSCRACLAPALASYQGLGLSVLRYGEFLKTKDIIRARDLARDTPLGDIASLHVNGVAVGEHALAGTLRFFARGDLNGEPGGEPVLRQFLQSALTTSAAMERLLVRERIDAAVFNHGIYVPQGIVGEALRAHGVPQVNWTATYRRQTFVFSHGDTYHRTMLTDPPSQWRNMPWTETRQRRLLDYLESRRHGTGDWIWFFDRPNFAAAEALRQLGANPALPCDGLLTSVVWDAVLHYESNAFPNMLEWIVATVHHYAEHPDRQLVIRVHPAEIRGTLPSRQRVDVELAQRHGPLPQNVILVPPEHPVSTYALLEQCRRILIYNTKMGVELSAMGKQVVVAGEAWIRGKGFSIDVDSPKSYAKALLDDAVDAPLDEARLLLARKYAYHFFFERMVELPMLRPTGGDPQFRLDIDSVRRLAPGQNANLDLVCQGIVEGTPILAAPDE
ncbi:Capsule polysaccharide biosynthesis protein [Humidesulfovibrio mexicanus]|uniref:Capsule polysaccharide biosynthesis protein n=1 Tax=Humidesulfovibrio mexicanus TaxID=147047 RepID=A0A238Y7I5_9BACT|nr:capsule biosynthesis protein [Humidesulfovibrio mexicanus]SNR66613.1 Capsule polysaccharide biosynthesis protein [Humidesulfovibrio mexicanus]